MRGSTPTSGASHRASSWAGLVRSAMPGVPGIAERTNPAQLEGLCDAPLDGVLPRIEGIDVERGVLPSPFEPQRWLGPQFGGTFDREAFLGALHGEIRAGEPS